MTQARRSIFSFTEVVMTLQKRLLVRIELGTNCFNLFLLLYYQIL